MQRMDTQVLQNYACRSTLACCVQAKAAAEVQSFSGAAARKPYLSFQRRRTEVFHLPQRMLPARWPIWLQCITVRASVLEQSDKMLTLIRGVQGSSSNFSALERHRKLINSDAAVVGGSPIWLAQSINRGCGFLLRCVHACVHPSINACVGRRKTGCWKQQPCGNSAAACKASTNVARSPKSQYPWQSALTCHVTLHWPSLSPCLSP